MRLRHASLSLLIVAALLAVSALQLRARQHEPAATAAPAAHVAHVARAGHAAHAAASRIAETREGRRYEARIRRTTHGVAHIEAADLAGLGFGEGFAQAEDHVCSIADQVIRVRGERAQHFGRGPNDAYVHSDIVMRAIRLRDGAAELLEREPQEVREWIGGFAAGYNHYLQVTSPDSLPDWCRGQAWVGPVTVADVAALYRLPGLGVEGHITAIATAAPPGPDGASATGTHGDLHALATQFALPAGASNGWAIGRERSESGRGMLLANPHYPWGGSNRYWEKHLRIPGQLDVYGSNIIGGLGVLIGFNDAAAWTLTTSHPVRFTLYTLELEPGQPTRYRYGDGVREMRSVDVRIAVASEPDSVEHRVWFTHYGPVVAPRQLPWTTQRAFSVRFANEPNFAMLRHILDMARARSLEDVKRAHAEHQALPFVNSVAVSADGVAWYADASVTPNLSAQALASWSRRLEEDPMVRQLWQNRIVLLDGSDPAFEWQQEPDARQPGVIPFSRAPQIERTDYVFNANDSYWLPHGSARIEGAFSPLQGAQRSPVSTRTRSNALHLENAAPHSPAGPDGRFSLDEMKAAVLANRSLTAELLVPELVERCRATPHANVEGADVDLTRACDVLAAWDRRYDLDSRGAVLFREWLGHYTPPELLRAGRLFAEDFDPDNPLTTPRGLAAGPLALENLGRAVRLLASRQIALDVPLGELQYAPTKLPRRIGLHGGNLAEGVLNLMFDAASGITTFEPLEHSPPVPGSRYLREAGYPILHGSSFIMALEFTEQGPRAHALLTYGQSGDPRSVHFIDQTELFARKEWRPVLFREEDIVGQVSREYGVGEAAGGQ